MKKTGVDDGPLLPVHSIDAWRKPAIIQDWQNGMTLRDAGEKYNVSHEKVRMTVAGHTRKRIRPT